MYLGDSKANDCLSIANLLADFVKSLYNRPDNNAVFSIDFIDDVDLSFNLISKMDIEIKIRALDNNKGPGHDTIPVSFLKSCCSSIVEPLLLIFNYSLKIGYFPDYWKLGIITPIYKADDKADVKNYRPVTILSAIPKLFDSLIYDQMYSAFKNVLIEEQHGFRKGRSALTNLCLYTHCQYMSSALDGGLQIDAIYTDFTKAFDKIDHNILLHKLRAHGVSDVALKWLSSYLCNRR